MSRRTRPNPCKRKACQTHRPITCRKFHHAHLATVKDVRSLCECALCSGIGHSHSMIELANGHAHGRCYIAAHGLSGFLALPKEQTGKTTLGDIGPEAMKALLGD